MSKKRNPQDATRRNVQAANKRHKELLTRLRRLELALAVLASLVRLLATMEGVKMPKKTLYGKVKRTGTKKMAARDDDNKPRRPMSREHAIARGIVGLSPKRRGVRRFRKPLRIHVYPIKDLRVHVLDTTCWCHPVSQLEGKGTLITHNADDGRDLVERHGLQ